MKKQGIVISAVGAALLDIVSGDAGAGRDRPRERDREEAQKVRDRGGERNLREREVRKRRP